MDSKQLVNDIVNNKLSKAKETIVEEMTLRVSDSIDESLSFAAGAKKAAVTGLALSKIGDVLGIGTKGKAGKIKKKETKKKDKAQAKYDIMWAKSSEKKKVDALEDKKIKPGRGIALTPEQKSKNDGFQDEIDEIKDDFEVEFEKKYKKLSKKTGVGKSVSDIEGSKAARAEKVTARALKDIENEEEKAYKDRVDKPERLLKSAKSTKAAAEGKLKLATKPEEKEELKQKIEDAQSKISKYQSEIAQAQSDRDDEIERRTQEVKGEDDEDDRETKLGKKESEVDKAIETVQADKEKMVASFAQQRERLEADMTAEYEKGKKEREEKNKADLGIEVVKGGVSDDDLKAAKDLSDEDMAKYEKEMRGKLDSASEKLSNSEERASKQFDDKLDTLNKKKGLLSRGRKRSSGETDGGESKGLPEHFLYDFKVWSILNESFLK